MPINSVQSEDFSGLCRQGKKKKKKTWLRVLTVIKSNLSSLAGTHSISHLGDELKGIWSFHCYKKICSPAKTWEGEKTLPGVAFAKMKPDSN